MFLLMRDSFLNHFSIKSAVVCQPVNKLGMFTCVCSAHIMLNSIFFVKRVGGPDFWIFGGETKKEWGIIFKGGPT